MAWNKEKAGWVEFFLKKIVKLLKLLTSWTISPLWGFAFPFLGGQPILFCIALGVACGILSHYVWREIPDVE